MQQMIRKYSAGGFGAVAVDRVRHIRSVGRVVCACDLAVILGRFWQAPAVRLPCPSLMLV